MKMVKVLMAAGVLAASLTGCSGGPHDAAGYTTVEKDGRLYVLIPRSGPHQEFQKSGELGKSVTHIGAGPNGMTIIAQEGVNIEKFRSALGLVSAEPVAQ